MLKPPDCLRCIGLVGVASRIIRGPAIQKRFQRAYRDRQDFKKLCSAAHAYNRVSVSFAGQTLQSAYSAILRVFPPQDALKAPAISTPVTFPKLNLPSLIPSIANPTAKARKIATSGYRCSVSISHLI
jgi:hypothetical protein